MIRITYQKQYQLRFKQREEWRNAIDFEEGFMEAVKDYARSLAVIASAKAKIVELDDQNREIATEWTYDPTHRYQPEDT